MALSVSGDQVEAVLRKLLPRQGYLLTNPPRRKGETGADIWAKQGGWLTAIECIGFQENPPLRSKQFYEAFFRAISRLEKGAQECVIALPVRFAHGMDRRARQYGAAWKRIAAAFPELKIWLVSIDEARYDAYAWGDWPMATSAPRKRQWRPKRGIGLLVLRLLEAAPDIGYEVMRDRLLKQFPGSKFDKNHYAWYKSQFKSSGQA